MNCAIIDLGSNTIRLCIYSYDPQKDSLKTIVNRKAVAGLASYIEGGRLTEDGMRRTVHVLESHMRKIRNFTVESTSVFATASLRNIENSHETLQMIESSTGLAIDLLSGEEEAYLGFCGAQRDLDATAGILVDIGGASTEITVFEGVTSLQSASLPFGSLSLFLDQVGDLLPTREERTRIFESVQQQVLAHQALTGLSSRCLYGIGGSVRAAGKLRDDAYRLGERKGELAVFELTDMLDNFEKDTRATMHRILRIIPDRIHTALPGTIALLALCDLFESEEIELSKYGLREGYLFERVLGKHLATKLT